MDDDYQTVNEASSERDEESSTSQEHEDDDQQDQTPRAIASIYETSVVNSESSFMPGQGAFSSTPAMSRVAPGLEQDSAYTMSNSDPSWTPSLESPIVRLNREISNFTLQEAEDSRYMPSTSAAHTVTGEEDLTINSTFRQNTAPTPRPDKGKGKDPLLHNVLRHNLYTAADNSTFENKPISPLKFKGKPKTPVIDKNRNPYLPPDDTPSTWSGVVDLRSLSPQKYRPGSAKPDKTLQTPQRNRDDDDDSFDALPPGMSPPVLMSPARPPRSSAELGLLKVGQTPARDASARITQDLLRSAQLRSGRSATGRLFETTPSGYYESSMSTAMSPPSLSRYNRNNDYSLSSTSISKDASLESMIRHIRDDIRPDVGATPGMSTTPGLRIRPKIGGAFAAPSQARQIPSRQTQATLQPQRHQLPAHPITPDYPQHQHLLDDEQLLQVGHDSLDSDSDSMDDEIHTAENPSAAFLMAASGGHRGLADDSFGSNGGSDDDSNDSLLAEEAADALIAPVHPFAGRPMMLDTGDDGFGDDDSDSFDGFEPAPGFTANDDAGFTETVFGVAPAQRAAMRQYNNNGGLRLHGQDLMDDTIGVGAQRAANGLIDESPTPAAWRD